MTEQKKKRARVAGEDYCNGKVGIDHYFSCTYCFNHRHDHSDRLAIMEAMSGQHFEFGQGEGGFV